MGISPWQRYRSIRDIGVVYIYSTISFYWITFIPGDDTNYKVNTNEETQHNVPVLTSPKRAPRETKNLSTLFNMLDIKNIPKMEMHSRTSMYIVYTHTHENRYDTLIAWRWVLSSSSVYSLYLRMWSLLPLLFHIANDKERKKKKPSHRQWAHLLCLYYISVRHWDDFWFVSPGVFFSQGCHFYFIFFLNIETFFLFPHPKFFEVCSFWFCSVLFFCFFFYIVSSFVFNLSADGWK